MLKIKDDVDLKELENHGFLKESWFDNQIVYVKPILDKFKKNNYKIAEIQISKQDKEIMLDYYEQYNTYFDDTLYDLIQAGLVEKVEEN